MNKVLKYISSLPHRQLRNVIDINACLWFSSLPHRQLRNDDWTDCVSNSRSLPHRQLRNQKSPVGLYA